MTYDEAAAWLRLQALAEDEAADNLRASEINRQFAELVAAFRLANPASVMRPSAWWH